MKRKSLEILPAILMALIFLSGCEAIGSIFKAGVWTGTILVIFILLVVIFIVAKIFSKSKND